MINPSPYSSAVPNTPRVTTAPTAPVTVPIFGMTSAVKARMPPSPWLSARITSVRYLIEITMTSAQTTTDASPNTLASVTAKPE